MTTSNCGLPDAVIHPHVDRCYQAGAVDALREAADAIEMSEVLGAVTLNKHYRVMARILRNRADQIARNEQPDVITAVETGVVVSAELLREAAALIRSRAEAATYVYAEHHPQAGEVVPWFEGGDVYSFDETDGPHIMAWSPAVALAVADWLDATAREFDALGDPDLSGHPQDGRRTAGIAVATTYLGRTS